MKRVWMITFWAVVSFAIGLWMVEDPGYVLWMYHNTSVEMPFWLACFLIFILFVAALGGMALIRSVLNAPETWRTWRTERAVKKETNDFSKIVTAFLSGSVHKTQALHLRLKHQPWLKVFSQLLLATLSSEKKHAMKPLSDTPLRPEGMQMAQGLLAWMRGEHAKAIAVFEPLSEKFPKNELFQKALSSLYAKEEDHEKQFFLLKKEKVIHLEAMVSVSIAWLDSLKEEQSEKLLEQFWAHLPSQVKKEERLLKAFIETLIELREYEKAGFWIEKSLSHGIYPSLFFCYASIEHLDWQKVETFLRKRLKKQGQSAELLFALGLVSYRQGVWGQAKAHLKTSLSLKALPEAHQLMAVLMEKTNDLSQALHHYKQMLS